MEHIGSAGESYLKKNIAMRNAGISVERVFLLQCTEARLPDTLDVLRNQAEAGIVVSVLNVDRAGEIARDSGLVGALDFGVLDDAIVSHWKDSEDRVFGVELDALKVGRYLDLFSTLQRSAGSFKEQTDITEERLQEILNLT